MSRFLALMVSLILGVSVGATPAKADLQVGETAPHFSADGFLGGEAMSFDLEVSLEDGPVVLYFFPAAFTPGCNIEASTFAQAAGEFEAAGATLIGVTGGNTDRLSEFSEKHCASAFPVAAVSGDVIADYEVRMFGRSDMSDRTSFVIAPDGTIILTYASGNAASHVDVTAEALQEWRTEHSQ